MIDYRVIADAVDHYASRGYEMVDAPWIVGREAYEATKPEQAWPFFTLGGFLPASGEQSFIEMLLDWPIKSQTAMCVTPCFRDETYDDLHLPYFMKLELIHVDPPAWQDSLDVMIEDAIKFFNRYCEVAIKSIAHSSQYDIVEKTTGIELGSYGRRTHKNLYWMYGTGVAEPRLSQVIAKL